MKEKIFRFLSVPIVPAFVLGLFGLMVGGVVNAQNIPPAPVLVSNAGSINTDLLCPIINGMFYVLISISIIMVLWAAYLYVTSEGEAEKPSQARKMVLYAAIGIVIALVARGFPTIVASLFPNASGDWGVC